LQSLNLIENASYKTRISETSSREIVPSVEILPDSVATHAEFPNCPKSAEASVFVSRLTPDLMISKVEIAKSAATCEPSVFVPSKRASLPQESFPLTSEGADDDFSGEEEKWRTDRFFLGTFLYVAINPRALTEKCASGASCPFHPFCDFAHESSELRERQLTQMWNFKTKLCDKFHSSAACCPYGNRW
jgi:hypothetical protein